MSDTTLRDGEAFSMHIVASDARVCVVHPADARTATDCAGLGLDRKAPSFEGVAFVIVRKPGARYTVGVKRVPVTHAVVPAAEQAPIYASRLVQVFGATLPPPLKVVLSSLHSSAVQTASGAMAYDIVFDVAGTTEESARIAHQHHVIVPVEGAEYAIAWASGASTAADVDGLAESAAASIRVSAPPGPPPRSLAHLFAMTLPVVVVLGVAGWLIVRQQRRLAARTPSSRARRKTRALGA